MKLLYLVLIVLFAAVSAEPSILIRKNVGYPEGIVVPTVGKEMIVSLQIFNLGSSSGYDVFVNDQWPDCTVSSGLDSVRWDEVPAKANFSHSFVVIPNKSGEYKPKRANIHYKDSKGTNYDTISNEIHIMRIYELNEVDKRSGAHVIQWTGFFLLSLLVLGGPCAVYVYINHNYIHGVAGQRKQRPSRLKPDDFQ